MNGFIQFTVPGGNERRSALGSQTSSAAQDENSVVFTKQQQPEFDKLRAALDQAIAAQHAPQAPVATRPTSLADELTKLAALRDQGILSATEFEQQKARLLAQ
nr:SHOCT domain-containing protein [Streptomyces hygroscopicus]